MLEPQSTERDKDLAEHFWENYYDNPLLFAEECFKWGHGDLAESDGLDEWQRDYLADLGDAIHKDPDAPLQFAVASGHGPGKSALVAIILLWLMSTRFNLSAVVTANTQNQLKTKTWRELALWHKRLIHHHWFKWTATQFFQADHPETWFASAVPNSEANSEAFAGLHARHVCTIYDEASVIPGKIWEVTSGSMTTPGAMWLVFGNPTRNTGRFRQCWGRFAHRWNTRRVDSRDAKMTNKERIQQDVDDYGIDSDYVRVRWLGKFPRQASGQFISSGRVHEAQLRQAEGFESLPRVLGVDVARFGDDRSALGIRQGRKMFPLRYFRGLATTTLAREVARTIDDENIDATFVDGVGVGGGVIDQLRSWGYKVQEVNGGGTPDDKEKYFNKRAEMWGRMKDWMEDGDLPADDEALAEDLSNIEYLFSPKNQIVLEKKEDMKKRGLASPDGGDCVGLTLAEKVLKDRKIVLPAEGSGGGWMGR